MSKIDVLLGLQWGDEGKGKIVDVLAPEYDIIARFQGGPNAGHTLVFKGKKYVLHCLPSGVFQPNTQNLIGNGMVIDPVLLQQEIDDLRSDGYDIASRLLVSKNTHLILPTHKLLDAAYEKQRGKSAIGSTLKGIGPTYTDKIARQGLRVGDIFTAGFEDKLQATIKRHYGILDWYEFPYDITVELKAWRRSVEYLKKLQVINSAYYLDEQLREGKRVLAEGAQGTLLDVELGSYPYVTSSNTVAGGVCNGLGVSPHAVGKVYGVFKAYATRVGSGAFPTELSDEIGQKIRKTGKEVGATTGRDRRCGWLDLVALRYACMINGVTELYMTKSDVLSGLSEIKAGVKYRFDGQETDQFPFEVSQATIEPIYETMPGWHDDITALRSWAALPDTLQKYIEFIESYTKTSITLVSVGPDRQETIKK